jgi:GT2 family glycosyltransferase
VLDQTYPSIQYIVQDGGSDDGTLEILQRHAGRLAAWESAADEGQTNAINKGFARSTGEIMAWLNSDDMLLPTTVAYVVDYFRRHPEVDMVYGHRIVVDEQDREVGLWILPPHSARALRLADFVPQETLFWRRRVWDRIGPLDETFHFAMDWDFLLRAQAAGFRIVRLPRFLACFRAHEAQKTATEIGLRGAEEMRRLRVRSFGREPSRAEVALQLRPYLLRHALLHLGYRLGLIRY